MKNQDWQDALKAMLPQDYTPAPEPVSKPVEKPWPKLTVTLDRKRAGKTATIISGFDADDPRCEELARELKKKLACGGSTRDGEILIQGDRVAPIKDFLNHLKTKNQKPKTKNQKPNTKY